MGIEKPKKPRAPKKVVVQPEPIKVAVVKPKKPRAPKKVEPLHSEKAAATAKGEPWVSVLSVELDIDNPSNGALNLDWNEIFVARLVKAGYKGRNDIAIVDQWFTDLCRNILTEQYEQEQADPTNRK